MSKKPIKENKKPRGDELTLDDLDEAVLKKVWAEQGKKDEEKIRKQYEENKEYWDVFLPAYRKKHGIHMLDIDGTPLDEDGNRLEHLKKD